MRITPWLLGLALGQTSPLANAAPCPVMLKAEQVMPYGLSIKRNQLFAFRATTIPNNLSSLNWESFPLHLDPLDRDGKLDFSRGMEPWGDPLNPHDRVVLLSEDFVEQPEKIPQEQWPCEADAAYEARLAKEPNRKALLFLCRTMRHSFKANTSPVELNEKSQTFKTDTYQYSYRSTNQLLFEKISLKNSAGNLTEISSDADQLIHADVKNFFSMRFRANDVEAKILDYRSSALGLASRLSFYLKILFFRIDLSLLPEAYYFRDSVYIPMVMHLPVNATEYLNFRSGVFFTWRTANGVSWDLSQSRIPIIRDYLSAKSLADLKSRADLFCSGETCRFSAAAVLPSKERVELIFSLRRELVNRGFLPFFIDDSLALEKTWGKVSEYPGRRQGFFFETSGLGKGSHQWDFWIRFDTPKQGGQKTLANDSCPSEVIVRRL